jgi:transglycosylase-like protein with SLT domain
MYKILILPCLIAGLIGVPLPASAQSPKPQEPLNSPATICPMIESAAHANSLPIDFFTRLIWQESHFRSHVLGPLTRGGQRAEGIAQFMPATAAEHRLLEPFNPVEALPKAGEFLAELRAQFGNLGLTAAAYNAGPQRLQDFLGGTRNLPTETRKYVMAVTGRSIEDWVKNSDESPTNGASKEDSVKDDCLALTVLLRRSRLTSAIAPIQRVPQWCMHLHHPNAAVCGVVHQPVATALSSLTKLTRHIGLKYQAINRLQ